jgi:ComF family protein
MRAATSRLAHGAVQLCWPLVCAACGESLDRADDDVLCTRCRMGWVRLPYPQCARCGHPKRAPDCQWCDRLPPFVRAARSVVWYPDGSARQTLAALKYAGWRRAARPMATEMARVDWPADVRQERAACIPVPLSASREEQRGFNQSEVIARAMAMAGDPLPIWTDLLLRTRATGTQTRLTSDERQRNVRDAFALSPGARTRLRGRHIILLDDVITTAATLNACATVLVEGGARVVSFLSFGRARAPHDEAPPEPRRT